MKEENEIKTMVMMTTIRRVEGGELMSLDTQFFGADYDWEKFELAISTLFALTSRLPGSSEDRRQFLSDALEHYKAFESAEKTEHMDWPMWMTECKGSA